MGFKLGKEGREILGKGDSDMVIGLVDCRLVGLKNGWN